MKRKMSPLEPLHDENDLDLEEKPTKKLNMTESKYIEAPLMKDPKEDKMEDRSMEKSDNFKGFSSFNIVNIDKQDPANYKEYKRLKYKNIIYNINDILMIRNCEDANNDFVGILRKIIKILIESNVNILIEVQW